MELRSITYIKQQNPSGNQNKQEIINHAKLSENSLTEGFEAENLSAGNLSAVNLESRSISKNIKYYSKNNRNKKQ